MSLLSLNTLYTFLAKVTRSFIFYDNLISSAAVKYRWKHSVLTLNCIFLFPFQNKSKMPLKYSYILQKPSVLQTSILFYTRILATLNVLHHRELLCCYDGSWFVIVLSLGLFTAQQLVILHLQISLYKIFWIQTRRQRNHFPSQTIGRKHRSIWLTTYCSHHKLNTVLHLNQHRCSTAPLLPFFNGLKFSTLLRLFPLSDGMYPRLHLSRRVITRASRRMPVIQHIPLKLWVVKAIFVYKNDWIIVFVASCSASEKPATNATPDKFRPVQQKRFRPIFSQLRAQEAKFQFNRSNPHGWRN